MEKIILTLFLVVLLTNLASAFTFINIYVDETGKSLFLGETNESLTSSLPENIKLENGEIVGSTQILTTKRGELWTFKYELAGSELNIILPEGAVIKSITPGVEISLEKGRISIFSQDVLEVGYEIEAPEESTPIIGNVPLMAILIAIAVILVVFLINYSKRKDKEDKKEKSSIEHLLNEREKLIIKKLEETGKIKSSQLRKITEIPKASFSRHVQELEKKKLIKRSGDGKNKFVELAE